MAWLRVDDGILEHPKFIRAVRVGGSAAIHLWLALAAWCSKHLTDGEVPADMLSAIPGPRGAKVTAKAYRALGEASLIARRSDGGVTLVSYLEFNPSRAEVLATRGRKAKSQRSYRDREKVAGNAQSALPVSSTVSSRAPSPSRPHPHPHPQDPPVSPPAGDMAKRAKPRSKLPQDFAPRAQHQSLATELGVSLADEFPRFRDYHAGKGSLMADWDSALRTWLRNARRFQRAPAARNGVDTQATLARIRMLEEQEAAEEARQSGPS